MEFRPLFFHVSKIIALDHGFKYETKSDHIPVPFWHELFESANYLDTSVSGPSGVLRILRVVSKNDDTRIYKYSEIFLNNNVFQLTRD